jgi:hypothetical protein
VGLRADVYVVTKRKFYSCRESNPGSSLVALLSELSLFVAQRKCLPFYPSIPFTDCKQAYHRKRIIVSCCAFKLNLVPLLSTCRERMRLRPYISVIALVTHFMGHRHSQHGHRRLFTHPGRCIGALAARWMVGS